MILLIYCAKLMGFVSIKFAVEIETKYVVFRYKTFKFGRTKIVVEIWKFWNLISEEAKPGFVRVHTVPVTVTKETEHWFCGFADKSRSSKGLPLVNPETGEQFCCPKSFISFRNFKIHAGESHLSELKSSGQLQFRHVFSRPPEVNA